jgi:hypothetical protein
MHSVIRAGELPPTSGGTVIFEGEPYGSGVSLFLVSDLEPGSGAALTRPLRGPLG